MEQTPADTKQVEYLHGLAIQWEKELEKFLEEQPLGRSIEYAINQLRSTYQDIIFLDFEYAIVNGIENKIWTKHHKVIQRYRQNISRLRESTGKKKPIELRKMITNFVNFIKATTKFYRGFIQRLASHFAVYELQPVIEQFKLTISDPDEPITCSQELKHLIIRSCHRCLVILGDLSRYREVESATEKNWAPATGYYNLAQKLIPESGAPHNQLAVISINDGSNLSATYHLYRAVSVKEPFPEAGNNLGLGFQKILKAYKSGKLGSNLVRKEEQIVSELLSLFVRLHAKCFNGKGLSDVHESLQTEMLAQLTQDLKERLLSKGMLNKLVLINIAAEAYAENRRPGREAAQAVNNFLRLNVETFNTLLLVFQPELERVSVTRDKPSSAPNAGTNSTEYVSAVGRRMLPALRLYSKWLLVSHEKLHNTLDDTALAVQTKQLWQTYANTLSLLAVTFEVEKLPRLDYMLEEDEDIIGFLPLSTALSDSEPQKSEGLLKKDHKLPYRVHPNEEQLTRVLLLLEDGLKLCGTPGVPIAVVDGTITYQEDGLNTSILPSSSPAGLDSLYRSAGTEQFANPDMLPVPPQTDRPVSLMVGPGGGSVVGSVAPSESASVMVAMNKMVDSLVGPTGGVFDEEDEIDLEEKSDQRSTQKRVGKGPKENPEDEEIVFVGRKGRGRNFQSTGFLPTGATLQTPKKIEAEEGLAGARRLSATINTRNTPLRETFTTQSPISTSRPAFLTDNSVLNTGLTTTFQTQPLQQTSFTSNQVAASARSPASDRPQPGTITAMDLVNQMHIIGHRGPKTATLSRPSIDIGALPPLNRPLGDHNNDIWWTPPPVLPQPPHPPSLPPAPASPPVLSNAGGMTGSGLTGVYSEGDTSLYLYRPDSGWSQSQLPTGAGTSENSQQYGTSGIIQQFGAAENLHHFGTSGNSQQYGSGEDSQPYAYGTAGTSQQYGTGGYSQQYGNGNGS